MNNTMTAHEPINYLDSILNEEEKRCEYSHQWRNFTISRSGRFKSKNKKRDVIDGKFFDTTTGTTSTSGTASSANSAMLKGKDDIHSRSSVGGYSLSHKEQQDKLAYRNNASKSYHGQSMDATARAMAGARKPTDSYKSFYETNL